MVNGGREEKKEQDVEKPWKGFLSLLKGLGGKYSEKEKEKEKEKSCASPSTNNMSLR